MIVSAVPVGGPEVPAVRVRGPDVRAGPARGHLPAQQVRAGAPLAEQARHTLPQKSVYLQSVRVQLLEASSYILMNY